MILVRIFTYLVTYKSICMRTIITLTTESIDSLRTKSTDFELFLQHKQLLFSNWIKTRNKGDKLHSKCNKSIVLIFILKFEYTAYCLIIHNIFYIYGYSSILRLSNNAYFWTFCSWINQLSVYFLFFCSTTHYCL
jgi:hypothetical protein